MIDAKTGKVVGQMEICADTDATAFDPATKYVFTSCSGTMTIGHEDSPTKLSVVQTLTTIAGGQTMAVDLKTHNIYVAGYDTQPGAAGRRPTPVPDTFRALVFAMSGK